MVKSHQGCGFSKAMPSLQSSPPSATSRPRRVVIEGAAAASLTRALTLAGLITEPELDLTPTDVDLPSGSHPAGDNTELTINEQPDELENDQRWDGGPLPEMSGTWCSRSWMSAGELDLLLEESFIRSNGTSSRILDGGELYISIPNVIDFGVITFSRSSFYRPVRLCQEWTASVLRESPAVEALLNHDSGEIATAFREFWDIFQIIWEVENLNHSPCAELLLLTENREDSHEDSRASLTNRWRCE